MKNAVAVSRAYQVRDTQGSVQRAIYRYFAAEGTFADTASYAYRRMLSIFKEDRFGKKAKAKKTEN